MHEAAHMTLNEAMMWAGPLPPAEPEKLAIETVLWTGPPPPDGSVDGRKERKVRPIGFAPYRALEAKR
jgi:hypothetical protein